MNPGLELNKMRKVSKERILEITSNAGKAAQKKLTKKERQRRAKLGWIKRKKLSTDTIIV